MDIISTEDLELELRNQARYWQGVLSLSDWKIDVRLARSWEMVDADSVAQCQFFLERKDAIISILHPMDLQGVNERFVDEEASDYDLSLVHELLHLHLATIPMEDEWQEMMVEQAINAISRGLIQVFRAGLPNKVPVNQSSGVESGYI